jgi:hypothetical protein
MTGHGVEKNRLTDFGTRHCGICRCHENVENPQNGFPTFSQHLGKLSAAKAAAASFPQLPQCPAGVPFGNVLKMKISAVSDPIDVWHGDNQCREFGMKLVPMKFNANPCWAH